MISPVDTPNKLKQKKALPELFRRTERQILSLILRFGFFIAKNEYVITMILSLEIDLKKNGR